MQASLTYEEFIHYAEETKQLGGAATVRKINCSWFEEEIQRSGPIDRKAAREILWILKINPRWNT